jgi:FKBP12-rapamycin complex-associated protein
VADAQAVTDVSLLMGGLTPSDDQYYPTVVLTTLMNLLKDPSNLSLHQNIMDAVMNIYTTMGLQCVTFLNQVVPGFITVIQNAVSNREEGFFSQLAQLVRIVKQHIRPWLPQIIDLITTFWHRSPFAHATMLHLIENIARSLEGEFKIYLAQLLPLMLGVLDSDRSAKRSPSERVLHAFLVFGASAEEYMHLIIPVMIRMFDPQSAQPIFLRKMAMESLGKLSKQINLSEFAARIVHPLTRVMAGNDPKLRQTAVDTLCALVFQMGTEYLNFVPTVKKVMTTYRIQHANYSLIISKLQRGEALPQDLSPDAHYRDEDAEQGVAEPENKNIAVNQQHLKNAWEAGNRSTKEDWAEWMRRINTEMLKESPQPALRACYSLALANDRTARALFNSAFVSCFGQLFPHYQLELCRNIETALSSENIGPDVVQTILNLAEFMEHDDKALPIDVRALGQYAGKCHAFAKALHYKELEFDADQSPNAVEALISINNQLQQADAAFGILNRAQTYNDVDLKETWYEKLNRWEEALASYEKREKDEPYNFEVTMGKMRCLHALGNWDSLSAEAEDKWVRAATDGHQRYIAPLAAAAAWGLGQWELMDKYLGAMNRDTADKAFFGAILSIQRNQFVEANSHIAQAREGLDSELSALLKESYTRAYGVIVRVQMLAELEEIIAYKQFRRYPEKQALMRSTWDKRLKGCQQNVEVWQRMLKVRALVVSPHENEEMWIRFANLCRKSKRSGLARKALQSLVPANRELFSVPKDDDTPHAVSFAILKYMWSEPGQQGNALHILNGFSHRLSEFERLEKKATAKDLPQHKLANGTNGAPAHGISAATYINGHVKDNYVENPTETQQLLAKCYLKQGKWQQYMAPNSWRTDHAASILNSFAASTKNNPKWHKAWHAWALANFDIVTSLTAPPEIDPRASSDAGRHNKNLTRDTKELSYPEVMKYVVPAIQGFFKSIALSSTSSMQDTLRLLTLWFAHGKHVEVTREVSDGFKTVSIDTWLGVIPQLIARINQSSKQVRHAVHVLLCEVGRAHPQALVYPLTVSMKSEVHSRSEAAHGIMKNMRQHSPKLVEQAELVSTELVRIAVLWHEQWYEALEEASRLYFGDDNVDAMFATLNPLHDLLDRGPQTLREVSFIQAFGRDLHEAREWCVSYNRTFDRGDLQAAWDVYYQVFQKIKRQLQSINNVELQYVSPSLREARDLDLAVPGTYQSGKAIIRIASFEENARVINSKQRPRELRMTGSDGATYGFLLKGREDIRQDERVMQLFGLVNNLLANDPESLKRHLNIQRYSAVPLSHQCGLLGWVPHSDTLHELIRSYRESRKILINIEHRIMLQMAPDYDNLTLMQKVEVFTYAMDNTTGKDLYRVLWLKSKSSEAWLNRRTNYIRSLAVMSMVGYILGLGDRHPSNLMMDKITGNIVHIDFGDCFEVAMHREKYPERVPFRLTRMLTYAMEVSTIEGSYRTTCEHVMRVLRDNKESLMAVLEAFIHDPLLTWRLDPREDTFDPTFPDERRASIFDTSDEQVTARQAADAAQFGSLIGRPRARSSTTGPRPAVPITPANVGLNNAINGAVGNVPAGPQVKEDPEQAKEVQNERALQVLARVKEKLTGRDFGPNYEYNVKGQVDRLLAEATGLENLCQHYIGESCMHWTNLGQLC